MSTLLITLLPVHAIAQADTDDTSKVEYDVASIRPFQMQGPGFSRAIADPLHEARFRATAVTLSVLLHFAYDVDEQQIAGAPGWASSLLFNVEAKGDENVSHLLHGMTDSRAKTTKKLMLQQLLKNRFMLVFHSEPRSGTVGVLSVSKDGLKIVPDKMEEDDSSLGVKPNMHFDANSMVFTRVPFGELSRILSEVTQQKIDDETGLSGSYTFSLKLQRENSSGNTPGREDVFFAVREALRSQIGLEMTVRKREVVALVVDHVEKPSPN